jgi:hypothetical protein
LAVELARKKTSSESFSEAMGLISTDPLGAARILQELFNSTGETRVLLELGRAFYEARDLASANEVFVKALQKPLPYEVRRKVEAILSEIKEQTVQLNISFSLIRDTNPRSSSETQEIVLFGLPFIYQPETPAKTEIGSRVFLGLKTPSRPSLNPRLEVSYINTDFPGRANDRQVLVSKAYLENSLKRKDSIGVYYDEQYLAQRREVSVRGVFYDTPLIQGSTWMVGLGLKAGKTKYDYSPFYDSKDQIAQLRAFKRLPSQQIQMFFEAGYESNDAEFDFYSRKGKPIAVGFQKVFTDSNLSVTLVHRNLHLNFQDSDPFFGLRRKDKTTSNVIRVRKENLYFWGVKPALEFHQEKRKSNVSIAEYKKEVFGITFERVF